MQPKVDVAKLRQSVQVGLEKTSENLVLASERALENPTKLNKQKASQARKRNSAYVEALEMTDDELISEFLAGTLFK